MFTSRHSGGAAKQRPGQRSDQRSGEADGPVRRIDWQHCTVLPAAAVPEAKGANGDGRATGADGAPEDVMEALRDLFDQVVFDDSVPLYIATLDGQLVHVNDGYRKLVEQKAGDAAGQDWNTRDSDSHLPPGLRAVIEEVQLVQRSVTLEEKIKIDDGIKYFRSRHFPVTSRDGAILAVGGTYVDCTDQVAGLEQLTTAQQRFRDFARASSDWFWETDRDGRLTMLSDRLTAILGLPAAGFLGSFLDDIGGFKGEAGAPAVADEAMRSHRSFREQLFEMRDSDGAMHLFAMSAVPVFDTESGEFEGYRGAGMDVTDRILAEREARAARSDLENTLEELTNKNVQLDMASADAATALKAKNEFLAAMSHELRTPLNAIIGFAEAMSMEIFGDLNDHYRSYSTDILTAGRHLLGLINDVLDVAVIESDKLTLEPETVALEDLVRPALNLVIMRANEKRLDVSRVQVDSHWRVRVDVRRAIQIFVNLFSNAVKFTPEKGAIGIDVAKRDGGLLAVTVWDTGIGISADKQALVFEKFQQVTENIYSRREEGTGLGLHISRELARLMGGDMELESEVGTGSRFTVLLPLDQA